MFKRHIRPAGGLLAAVALAAGCAGSSGQAAQRTPAPVAAQGEAAAIARARADSVRHPYTEADIQFMTGMIAHHAQAIVMAGWAPTHGASPEVRTLCARILNAQRDEIRTMQNWLRDRNQPVPEPTGRPMAMDMPGMAHDTLMPGMLNAAQLDTLDAARGHDFDVYFLRYMIQHHTGAIEMVKQLFGSYGAAEDELTFKLASDINVDQTTEVARMQKLLASLVIGVPIQ
jgi:uncharacterized protein (DUF305 family)